MDSLLNYIGHKSKILDQIVPHFPQCITGVFYDAFAGSCTVGLSVDYPRVTCVELNPHLSGLYGDLSNTNFHTHLVALINQYGLTNSSVVPRSQYLTQPGIGTVQWQGETVTNFHLDQLNKPGYGQLLLDFNSGKFTGIDRSAAYMIATIYGRNSSVNTDTSGRLSGAVGPLDFSLRCHAKLLEHQRVIGQGRHSFVQGSYDSIQPGENDFVYMDPPYLASGYRYSGWSEADEIRLLSWVDDLPCPWAISNSLQSGTRINHTLTEWSKNHRVIRLNKHYRKWAGGGAETRKRPNKINHEVLIVSDNYTPRGNPDDSEFANLFEISE
jgi:site-specific DNA-adenine methylase